MDPDLINLETMSKMFEYEKQCRLIDDLNLDEVKEVAKSYPVSYTHLTLPTICSV